MLYDGDGEKPRNIKKTKQRKKIPFGCPSIYEVEADCFPVSENKPDLPSVGEVS